MSDKAFFVFIIFLVVLSALVGVAAGVFLKTFVLVILTALSVITYFIIRYGFDAGTEEKEFYFAITIACITVANIAMWAAFFLAETSSHWAWVGAIFSQGFLR